MNPDCKWVEPSIGYRASGVFAPYRAFTSYAQMHMFYGERGMLMNPSWFDVVIPNPFTVDEFEYKEDKEDYFLYFGRVIEEKGIHLAIQATEKLGKKLIIAGPGDLRHLGYNKVPDHVEVFGVADAEQRKQLQMASDILEKAEKLQMHKLALNTILNVIGKVDDDVRVLILKELESNPEIRGFLT